MSAVDDLAILPLMLSTLMDADARLLLVRAVAWLDPTSLTASLDPRDIDIDFEEEDLQTVGLHVCRICFPIVYAGAIQLQWQGATETQLSRYLLDGIGTQLVHPLQDLEELRYGPPVEFYGVSLELLEPAGANDAPYDRLLPFFEWFGLSLNGHTAQVERDAFHAARVLVASLISRPETVYQDLANLLSWMFSCSGNTAVDYSQEDFWESGFDYPDWTPNEVALINEVNREAHELITSALRALQLLQADPTLQEVLKRNVTTVLRAIQKNPAPKNKRRNSHAHAAVINRSDDVTPFTRYAHWPERP